ncbi:MAG: radical SAM protein [Polaromonas sp.]
MYSQLEITTRCNFSCWYCAGRDMPQQDMAWSTFTSIVDAIAKPGSTVSLQGEGEPSLHPRFWDMVQYVRLKGHAPYTIINGSRIDAGRIAQQFPRIGISLDTLDPVVAEKIGRHNLPKVLANLDALRAAMGPKRIVVMTVDLGQPLDALKSWVQQRGFASHIVQSLMRKNDYAQRYPQALVQPVTWHTKPHSPIPTEPQTCRFLHQDVMRYHTWSGLALPCCFIKDTQGIESIEGLRGMLARGQVPAGCAGCRELGLVEKQSNFEKKELT